MILFAGGVAEFENVQVKLRNFPYKEESGLKKFIDKDFGAEFIHSFFQGNAFPLTRSSLFTLFRQCCFGCGSKLPTAQARSEFIGTLLVMGHQIEVTVCANDVICPECSLKQLLANAETMNNISEALAILFSKIELQS